MQPTAEQAAVVASLLRGHNAVATAVPGAGKTTLALEIARTITQRGGRISILLYNTQIATETRLKLDAANIDDALCSATTIHAFVGRAAGVPCKDDADMYDIIERLEKSPGSLAEPFDRGLLIIDEAQDMRPSLLEGISAVLAASRRVRDVQLLVLGDPHQLLYDYDQLGTDRATTDFIDDPAASSLGVFMRDALVDRHRLSVSFRLTPAVAHLASAMWKRADGIIVPGNPGALPVHLHYMNVGGYNAGAGDANPEHSRDDMPQLVKLIQASVAAYGIENVLVVMWSTTQQMSTQLEAAITQCTDMALHLRGGEMTASNRPSELRHKLNVTSSCRSKGLEYDCVWFIGFNRSYGGTDMQPVNQVCVSLTRARRELHVVASTQAYALYPPGGDAAHALELPAVLAEMTARKQLETHGVGMFKKKRETHRATTGDKHLLLSVTTLVAKASERDKRIFMRELLAGAPIPDEISAHAPSKTHHTLYRSNLEYDISGIVGKAVPASYVQRAFRRLHPDVHDVFAFKVTRKEYNQEELVQALQRQHVDFNPTDIASVFAALEARHSRRKKLKKGEKLQRDECREHLYGKLHRGTMVVDIKTVSDAIHPSLLWKVDNAIEQLQADGMLNLPGIMYAITLQNAFKGEPGFINKMKHMSPFPSAWSTWVRQNGARFEQAVQTIGDALAGEKPAYGMFEVNHNFRGELNGYADFAHADVVYEFKHVSSLRRDHLVQVAIYCAMRASDADRPIRGVLLNTASGTTQTIVVAPRGAADALQRLLNSFKGIAP